MQETFVKLLRAARKRELVALPTEELAAFAQIVARRVALDLYRGRARAADRDREWLEELMSDCGPPWNAEEVSMRFEVVRAVLPRAASVTALRELVLAAATGATNEELAAVLGVPVGSLKSRLRKIRSTVDGRHDEYDTADERRSSA